MSTTEIQTVGIDPQVLADLDAVMRRIIDGTVVDAETSRRIGQRADLITEAIRRRGVMNDERFQSLLHDDDDE